MSAPVAGVGFLLVEDILEDVSYVLFEPIVAQTFPVSIAGGIRTIAVFDPSIYIGCQLVAGYNTTSMEVVTVTSFVAGVSFTATFTQPHAAGDAIRGATFPVQQTAGDPLFEQLEIIAYASTALNDFLTDCPLYYEIATVIVGPTQQNASLPSDCQYPVRVAPYFVDEGYGDGGYGEGGYGGSVYFGYPLRETSMSNLDAMMYLWTQAGFSEPMVYFRDKIPMKNIGVWPRAGNFTPLEVVYAGRGPQTLGLADGFPIPDPFLLAVKYRTLSFAFSKDGEMRQPGLAKYFQSRYETSVKIAKVFLTAIQDPNLQMAS